MQISAVSTTIPGTIVGRLKTNAYPDFQLQTSGTLVGRHEGYADLNTALDALKGATSGNLPAAVLLKEDGRFFGHALDQRYGVVARLGGMPSAAWPFHVADVDQARQSVALTASYAYAIVDGDVLIGRS